MSLWHQQTRHVLMKWMTFSLRKHRPAQFSVFIFFVRTFFFFFSYLHFSVSLNTTLFDLWHLPFFFESLTLPHSLYSTRTFIYGPSFNEWWHSTLSIPTPSLCLLLHFTSLLFLLYFTPSLIFFIHCTSLALFLISHSLKVFFLYVTVFLSWNFFLYSLTRHYLNFLLFLFFYLPFS